MTPLHICMTMPDPRWKISPQLTPHSSPYGGNGAMEYDKMWRLGETKKMLFLGGDRYIRALVIYYFRMWLKYANLKLNIVQNGYADIRISFVPGGSWSYVGTTCRDIDQQYPTMNFGTLLDQTPSEEASPMILHELGHALGFVHEHQISNNGIQ